MPNDTNTLNGALQELGETMAANLTAKGVTSSASEGLTTLANKVLDIQTGGSCYHIELDKSDYTTTGSLTVTATLQNQYQPYANQTVTFTGGTSTVTATTDSNGVATATVTFSASGTLTASYSNVSDTATVTVQTYIYQSDMTTDDGNWTKSSSSGMSITYSTDGCTVKGTTSSDRTYNLSSSITLPTNFVVEYDITAYALGAYDNSTEFVVHNSKILFEKTKLCIRSMDYNYDITNMDIPATPIQIKVEVNNGTISTYVNGSLFGTSSVMSSYKNIGFKTYNRRSITVKNFRISAL